MIGPALSLLCFPARRPPRRAARPATLKQCLLLALLLHVWAVVLLGSTPGGSAQPGEGVWGPIDSLDITLQGLPAEGGASAETVPDQPSGPVGTATPQRFGGVVREADAPAAVRQSPGAARFGRWQPSAAPPSARAPSPAALPDEPSQPSPAPLPAPTPTDNVDPSLDPEPVAPVRAAAPAPPRLEPLQQVTPLPMPRLDSPVPVIMPATTASPSPSPISVPVPSAQQPADRTVPAEPAPNATAPLPPVQRTPAAEPAHIAPVTPTPLPPLERRMTLPPSVSVMPTPVSTPTPTPAQVPTPSFLTATATATASAPTSTAASTSKSTATPASPRSGSTAATVPAAPGTGSPDAGSRVGHDVATAPSMAASAPAPLDLRLPSLRGGAISRQASPGMFQMIPHPPEQKSKLANEIENAAQPDCRTAYADKGLIAVVPLVGDAVKGTGCRW